ncbi:MAG: MarR family transcriptional regulator [Deltaproteobacteria bacterium]|nr:MarR family transcriptional regulator [Deltaproteobacteria bacterium]MBW2220120.1 MarR family transcriptional regulator [Deltaproteobacteria bacterium]
MKEIEKLARNIFTTGKLIRNRVFKVQSKQLAALGKKDALADLTAAQLHTMIMVNMRGRLSMNELSDLLGVSPPSTSVMVEKLVEKGILARNHSVEDRRKVIVQISPQAINDMKSVEDAILQSFVELVERIGPETAKKWSEVLEKIKPVLEKES